MNTAFQKPRWLRDLLRFIPLKSQFVLFGNVRDLQASEVAHNILTPLPFNKTLYKSLYEVGYIHIITYTQLTGFQWIANLTLSLQGDVMFMKQLGFTVTGDRAT
ncbi:ATP-dependent Clp protease ATP-binding subunit, partial [Proteus columbae]|nr:ATP-dependent Clp protease ATP-binding subunit [Proteus columbae]